MTCDACQFEAVYRLKDVGVFCYFCARQKTFDLTKQGKHVNITRIPVLVTAKKKSQRLGAGSVA